MAKNETEKPVVAEKRYVVRRRQIDLYNNHNELIEVTPAVCDVCGYDVVVSNPRLPQYSDASDSEKRLIEALVGEHKEKVHTGDRSRAVTESEVSPRWLSQGV